MTRTFDVTVIKRIEVEDIGEITEIMDRVIDDVVLNNTGKLVFANATEV